MPFDYSLTPETKNILNTQLDKMEASKLKKLVWTMPIKDIALHTKRPKAAVKKTCDNLNIKLPPNNLWDAVKLGLIQNPNGIESDILVPELKNLRLFKERTEMFEHTEWFHKVKDVAHLPWHAMTRAQILAAVSAIPISRVSSFFNATLTAIEKKHNGIKLRAAL